MPEDLSVTRRAVLAGTFAAVAAPQAHSQTFPSRPLMLVVTFAAGGGVDVVARLVAEAMGNELGQKIVVENRPGGGTITGTQAVVRAEADGHTLLAAPTTMVVNPAVRAAMPFDWRKDLAHLGLLAKLPFVVVVKGDSPLQSMKDLEALARTRAVPVTFASGGVGTVAHLAGELFALTTKGRMQHVPYRGEGPALNDVAGGSLDCTFATAASVTGLVQAGTLKALGATTAERSQLLPDVPTVAEQGYAGFDVSAWVSLAVPAATPSATAQRLRSALAAALRGGELKARLSRTGAIPADPDLAIGPFLEREAATWERVVKEAGIRIDS